MSSKKGGVPFWLILLILALVVLVVVIAINAKVFGGILNIFEGLGGAF